MTTLYRSGYGGETNDDGLEVCSMFRSSAVVTDNTAACIVTGSRCGKFPLNTSAAKAILPAYPVTGVPSSSVNHLLVGWFGLSAAPSSEVGLITADTQGGTRYIRIDTSGHIVVYGSGSVPLCTSTGAISTNATVDGLTHVAISIDLQTPADGTGSLTSSYINIWVGKKHDQFVFANATILPGQLEDACIGEWLPAATNRGADLYYDDVSWITYSTRAEAPHLQEPRVIKIAGGATLPAAADGSNLAWAATGGSGTNDYDVVDDFPNDGDTTYLQSGANSDKETLHYTASNPMSSSDTCHAFINGMTFRLLGGMGKGTLHTHIIRDNSGNEATNSPGNTPTTSYTGDHWIFNNSPSGGTWAYTDGDLTSGKSNTQFGVVSPASGTPGHRVTNLSAAWIFSSEALGAGMTAAQGFFVGV